LMIFPMIFPCESTTINHHCSCPNRCLGVRHHAWLRFQFPQDQRYLAPERGHPAIRAVAGAPQQRSLRPAGTPGARLGSEPWKSDGKISESGDLIRENRDFQWEIYWKWPCRSWVNHLEIWYFFHGYVKLPTGNHKKWWFNWQQLSFFTLQNWEVQHFVTHKSARYSGM
jgi:hypothetical protein